MNSLQQKVNESGLTWLRTHNKVFKQCFNQGNRPFPSSLLPLFQNESKCETFHMKMSFTHKSIRMQIILIFIWKISHLDSVWNRGRRQLGNGLLKVTLQFSFKLSKLGSKDETKSFPELSLTILYNMIIKLWIVVKFCTWWRSSHRLTFSWWCHSLQLPESFSFLLSDAN